ncbi:hypothetical protein ACP4OV_001601 [Aristida adscensionis]
MDTAMKKELNKTMKRELPFLSKLAPLQGALMEKKGHSQEEII